MDMFTLFTAGFGLVVMALLAIQLIHTNDELELPCQIRKQGR
jgi:hypothetical protein